MQVKKYAKVNQAQCAACGACLQECPRNVITIPTGCYAVVDTASCLGCGKCVKICPANAIELAFREGEK